MASGAGGKEQVGQMLESWLAQILNARPEQFRQGTAISCHSGISWHHEPHVPPQTASGHGRYTILVLP